MKFLLLFLLLSCETPELKQPPNNPVGRWNNPAYDTILINALDEYGKDLLKSEPSDCAEFNCIADRKRFWFNIMVEMAYYESSWKTETAYKESFKDQKGNYIYSRGLLQLSIESGKGYGCPFKTEADIHDPKLNLECGVRILNRWVVRDGRIAGKVNGDWKGGARYWSVLRQNVGEVKKSTEGIKNANR